MYADVLRDYSPNPQPLSLSQPDKAPNTQPLTGSMGHHEARVIHGQVADVLLLGQIRPWHPHPLGPIQCAHATRDVLLIR